MPDYENSFYIEKRHGIPLIMHRDIPFPHGFSTRLGGVSREIGYDTLDLGAGTELTAINENRRRFVRAISGNDGTPLVFAKQIHSAKTVYVDSSTEALECDALVTDVPGIIIAVKTADCIPILLCDPINLVVGAAHAGWRGTVAGVAAACLQEMEKRGARPSSTVAVIGAGIGRCCYEVDEKFVSAVAVSECAKQCIKHISGANHLSANLGLMNRDILISHGICTENIHISGFCTSCNSSLFFSHRASRGVRGLMMAGIEIPEIGI